MLEGNAILIEYTLYQFLDAAGSTPDIIPEHLRIPLFPGRIERIRVNGDVTGPYGGDAVPWDGRATGEASFGGDEEAAEFLPREHGCEVVFWDDFETAGRDVVEDVYQGVVEAVCGIYLLSEV